MKSDLPKVLHPLAGEPMLCHVLRAAAGLNPQQTTVVTGYKAECVEALLEGFPQTQAVRQTEQLGTGHAVNVCKDALASFNGTILILFGDAPMLTTAPLQELLNTHWANGNAITTLSGHVENPGKLGRILRDDAGNFAGTKEAKDCSPEELENTEVATAIFAVQSEHLFRLLARVNNNNKSGEYYLNGIEPLALAEGLKVEACMVEDVHPLLGCNSREELADAEITRQDDLRAAAMENGATLEDPATIYFHQNTQLGEDVTVGPNVYFGPNVILENGVSVESNCVLKNCTVGQGSTIAAFSHIDGATIGANASIGPFARIRPESTVGEGAKVGNFVELKKANLGAGSKASHLTYLGNAEIGANVNIGAGTITANYNSITREKYISTIANGASIGANTTLIAPVTVGENAFIAGGSTVRKNVPENALCHSASPQKTKENYTSKKD